MNKLDLTEKSFRTATRSSDDPDNNCVAVARRGGQVFVRDTKNRFGTEDDHTFAFSAAEFGRFLAAVHAAGWREEIPASALDGLCIAVERRGGYTVFRSAVPQAGLPADAALWYTAGEIVAFLDGVHNHEFDGDGEHFAHVTAGSCAVCAGARDPEPVAV